MKGLVAKSGINYYPLDWVFQGNPNPALNPDPDYNYGRNHNLAYISITIYLIIYIPVDWVFQGS